MQVETWDAASINQHGAQLPLKRILVAHLHCTTGELAGPRDWYLGRSERFEVSARAPDNG
jgi:hypothetical protein